MKKAKLLALLVCLGLSVSTFATACDALDGLLGVESGSESVASEQQPGSEQTESVPETESEVETESVPETESDVETESVPEVPEAPEETESKPEEPPVVEEPIVEENPIPKDEWFMILVNKENALSEDFSIETTAVDGKGHLVDSRIFEDLSEMISAGESEGLDFVLYHILILIRNAAKQPAVHHRNPGKPGFLQPSALGNGIYRQRCQNIGRNAEKAGGKSGKQTGNQHHKFFFQKVTHRIFLLFSLFDSLSQHRLLSNKNYVNSC